MSNEFSCLFTIERDHYLLHLAQKSFTEVHLPLTQGLAREISWQISPSDRISLTFYKQDEKNARAMIRASAVGAAQDRTDNRIQRYNWPHLNFCLGYTTVEVTVKRFNAYNGIPTQFIEDTNPLPINHVRLITEEGLEHVFDASFLKIRINLDNGNRRLLYHKVMAVGFTSEPEKSLRFQADYIRDSDEYPFHERLAVYPVQPERAYIEVIWEPNPVWEELYKDTEEEQFED